MERPNSGFILTLVIVASMAACSDRDATAPESITTERLGRRMTVGARIQSPLEWSADGSEIYAADRGQLVTITPASGAVRTSSGSCAVLAALSVTGAFATREFCGSFSRLRVRLGSRDTVIADVLIKVVRTPDRRWLAYMHVDTVRGCAATGCPPRIDMFEPATGQTRQVDASGMFPYAESDYLITDGSELVALSPWQSTYHTAAVSGGGWHAHEVQLTSSSGQPFSGIVGELVGGNADGIWTIAAAGSKLANIVTGRVFDLPDDPHAATVQWIGGTMSADGRHVALWRRSCTPVGEGPCTEANLTLWRYDLTRHTSTLVVAARNSGYGPVNHRTAFSPDGTRIAYVLDGDIYIADSVGS